MRQGTATELQQLRNLPHVTTRMMHTKRVDDILLELRGVTIGWKTAVRKRGRVVSTSYHVAEAYLPEFPPTD